MNKTFELQTPVGNLYLIIAGPKHASVSNRKPDPQKLYGEGDIQPITIRGKTFNYCIIRFQFDGAQWDGNTITTVGNDDRFKARAVHLTYGFAQRRNRSRQKEAL